jgi:outer membrane protein TolC
MSNRSLTRWTTALVLALPALTSARSASALQSIDEFVTSAKGRNLDNREAKATADQRGEESRQAWSKLGPSLSAKATYTRNQYPVTVMTAAGTVTITGTDQLDGVFTLNVPLVDVGSWERIGGAVATADAARVRAQATGLDVEKAVVRAYYQVVAVEATLAAAERALATSQESQAIVATRREAGSASELDTERARAEVARQRQVVASAEQSRAVARRSLESLTGLTPAEGASALPDDPLADEPALAALEPGVAQLPAVRAAALDARAADKSEGAAWAALAPTVAASATERLTSATGFSGRVGSWALAVSATWNVDLSTYYAAKGQSSARALAEVREKRAEQGARDDLHSAWQEVRADLARVRAARAEAEASARAARLAKERYQAGAATQLDVQQADRDAFSGEVARIQAQADLAYARASVRLGSGRPRGAAEGAR